MRVYDWGKEKKKEAKRGDGVCKCLNLKEVKGKERREGRRGERGEGRGEHEWDNIGAYPIIIHYFESRGKQVSKWITNVHDSFSLSPRRNHSLLTSRCCLKEKGGGGRIIVLVLVCSTQEEREGVTSNQPTNQTRFLRTTAENGVTPPTSVRYPVILYRGPRTSLDRRVQPRFDGLDLSLLFVARKEKKRYG